MTCGNIICNEATYKYIICECDQSGLLFAKVFNYSRL